MPKQITAQPARHSQPTVKVQRLAHIIFERPDLGKAESFLHHFGLRTAEKTDDAIYLRGAAETPYCYALRRGPKARFVGFGLEVGSREDLLKLAALPEASAVTALDTPGDGEVVRLTDPAGFLIEVVHGQLPYAACDIRHPLSLNSNAGRPRVNATQRTPAAPPDILKLGHIVLEVVDYQGVLAWYAQHFGLIPSDVQLLPDGVPFITFFRLDLGDSPADHHTLTFGQGLWNQFNHSAYEVVDQDAVAMGQRVLRDKGYDHAWGIGRHLLGSQIFDYWRDPWGFKHEHYCDGDVFTADNPTGVSYASKDSIFQWGPPVPDNFLKPKFSLGAIIALVRNLRRSPDLSVGKLMLMAKTLL
ncbi:MAG: 2,4,5-trihydroxytoluene oxygenase [Nevskiales bacterium]